MNKFRTSILALLFYTSSVGLADCSTDPLKAITDTCIEQPTELCEDQIVGQGSTRDTFILIVKLIKKHKKVMALYESRFGLNEVLRFNKLISFKPVLPNVSEYAVKHINKNEQLYFGKSGDEITLSRIAGKWKIDMNKSHFGISPTAGKIKMLRILLGFYHDLEERLEQKQSLEVIEKSTLLGLAGITYYDVPPAASEIKERFRKLLSENATTAEEIQRRFLSIADKL